MLSTTGWRLMEPENPMNHNEKSRSLLPDVKRMNCGILGLSPDHTGPLVYYSDAALAIKAALTSREPDYDRELIARMLTEYNLGVIGQFSPVAVEHQIKLLREAENRDAEGVRTEEANAATAHPSAPVGVEGIAGRLRNLAAIMRGDGGTERIDGKAWERVEELAASLGALAQQPAAVDEALVEQVASAIAIEDTGVSWHDVSPRDRAYYVRLARAALAAQQPAAVDGACAAAAIQFALTDPEGMTFLRLWNEGDFDTLRREWPDAPIEVYVGADPLATQPQGDNT